METAGTDIESVLATAMDNPDAALKFIEKALSAESLFEFIKVTWDVLEPGRKFVEGWAIEAVCEHLEAVSRGEIRRLLINIPPGCMKSLTCNVFWPAWMWGPAGKPQSRFIGASYADTLSLRDNRKFRILLQSAIYQELWGDCFKLSDDQNEKRNIGNNKTGLKLATSVSGVGTGERADYFIIDDPHNVKEADSDAKREAALLWFSEVVPSRLNDPKKDVIMCIMQRVHEGDVSGLILEKELGYDHLCLPMEYEHDHPFKSKTSIHFSDPRTEDGELLWPERFGVDELENDLKPQMRAVGGTYAEAGQLQQRPSPRGGGDFKEEDFKIVDEVPPGRGITVRAWDLAATEKKTSAYTAGVKMTRVGNIVYVEHVIRGQWGPAGVEDQLKVTASLDGYSVMVSIPQDPGQAGKAQVRSLAGLLHGYDVRSSPESGDKRERARPLAAQAEHGNLRLVRGSWNHDFIQEAIKFPAGKFKDQIDAASRGYSELLKVPSITVPVAPETVSADG